MANVNIGDVIQATDLNNLLAANDAMVFKGTLGTGGTITALPTTHSAGWAYKIIEAGTYANLVAEIGDLIVAVVDRDGSNNQNSDWIIVQTNIDGAVTGPASSTADNIALFDGTTGKLIKDSGTALSAKVDANASITGDTKAKITFDNKGLVTAGADLADTDIPNLSADKITSSVFNVDRIPTLAQSKITDLTSDLADKLPKIAEVIEKTGAYTLALTDSAKIIRVNSASNITVTIPPTGTGGGEVDFPIGTQIGIIRQGTGTVTIAAGSGVTIRSVDSKTKIKGQYSSAALLQITTSEWILVGSLEA